MKIINYTARYRGKLLSMLLAAGAAAFTVAMVFYPKPAFDAAVTGLNLWWHVVFPSLLPFFILSEMLMGLGVVHFIGILLEPLMRPVFNVPGIGAYAMSMGLASGYPMDAVITCKFRQNALCSAVEAERLLSFTNTADPLFMFGAVAVGMFGMPELGAVIALAHYVSSFAVGIIFRFHGRSRDRLAAAALPPTLPGNIILRALRALYTARREDGRSLGQLLGDAVKSSVNTILLIGGFIILFSVFLQIAAVTGVTGVLATLFGAGLQVIGFDSSLTTALVNGLFEIDLGALAASQANAPLTEKTVVVSAIIAWSGLSVHGQVASIVIESGIRMLPYMVARVLHSLLAAAITAVLMLEPWHSLLRELTVPVMLPAGGTGTMPYLAAHFEEVIFQVLLILGCLVILSLVLQLVLLAAGRKKK